MVKFIGRESELKKLNDLTKRKTASFAVIRGRRRIGKSRLVEEFGKTFEKFYHFSGLAPDDGVTAKEQIEEFSRQISQQFAAPFARYNDWSDALWAIGERVSKGKILLFFDEISWMAMNEPSFLGKIKALKYPKGYSCRPVLIHINGITQDVIDSDYFASIVDVSDFL